MIRVLQLTPRISWPPSDGGRVVMLQCARALHELNQHVEVLSLNPRRQYVDPGAAREAFAPIPFQSVDVSTTALPRTWRRGVPLFVSRFHSRAFEALVRSRAHDFDIVQIESPFLLPYAKAVRATSGALVVLRSLNVEFRIWERLAERTPDRMRRAAYRAIARSLRRYEVAQLDVVDAVVPITEAEAAEFRALGCRKPMFVLPGGVSVRPHSPARGQAVGFLGSLDYRPNQDAAIWIAEELGVRFDVHIAGSRAPGWLEERLSGVTFAGTVEDANAFIAEMAVMIAPIFSGGGMRIKILEAMAAGKPVVSTPIGAEGMDVRHGENILIADDASSFAAAIASLLADPARARAIGDAGRKLVAERYSTLELTSGLVAFYEELTQRPRVRRGG